MDNYQSVTEYLFRQLPMFERQGKAGYKPGLGTTRSLDAHFGHPHRSYTTIHVAGTNGKGSTSHTLAAALQKAGYRVGLYTSPHLVDFAERIRVDGQPIAHSYVTEFVAHERQFFEPLHPSFFELTTAMAFCYFKDMAVDVAVIEVGLGGRLDCTNVITPELSIITNISFDHTQFLGDTLPKIAAEKAGIIKPGVPVVIGESDSLTLPVFRAKAAECHAEMTVADEDAEVLAFETDPIDGGINYTTRTFGKLHGALGGVCQAKNTDTILCVMKQLRRTGLLNQFGENECQNIVRQAFAQVASLTGLQGRWQRLGNSPTVVCDTGHNVAGWQYLAPQIESVSCRQKRIVFGMVDDKDIDTVLSFLPRNAKYYFTQASTHRAIPAEEVCQKAAAHGLTGRPFPTVAAAYKAALDEADPADFVFVGGSSYVVADLLSNID